MTRITSYVRATRRVTPLFAMLIAVCAIGSTTNYGAQAPQGVPAQGAQPPAPAGGGRQGGPGPFAGQTPINALIVSGGCCHDYAAQNKILVDLINPLMPVNWTIVHGMTQIVDSTKHSLNLFENPDWAKGYDIVIHNECWANHELSSRAVQNLQNAHGPGRVAAMYIHCALHSSRSMTTDPWRELIGITSRRHTRAHNFAVKWEEDPITVGLPPFVTPIDELYVVEKQWPGVKAIATTVNAVDNGVNGPNESYAVAWTQQYKGGGRIFGTSIGHGNPTWETNQFKELVIRGFRWALNKEPIVLPPAAAPARGRGTGAPTAAPAAASAPAAGRGGQ